MEENERNQEGEVELWSWGAGTDGQLGTTRLEDERLPQLLNLPSFSSFGPISLLACGGAHVLALTAGILPLSHILCISSLIWALFLFVCLYALLQMGKW